MVGSPLALSLLYRGLVGCSLGRPGWRDDMRSAIAMQRSIDAQGVTLPVLISVAYACGILTGALLGDDDAVRETAEAVRIGEELAATRPAIATIGIATARWRSLGFEGHMKWAEAMP